MWNIPFPHPACPGSLIQETELCADWQGHLTACWGLLLLAKPETASLWAQCSKHWFHKALCLLYLCLWWGEPHGTVAAEPAAVKSAQRSGCVNPAWVRSGCCCLLGLAHLHVSVSLSCPTLPAVDPENPEAVASISRQGAQRATGQFLKQHLDTVQELLQGLIIQSQLLKVSN